MTHRDSEGGREGGRGEGGSGGGGRRSKGYAQVIPTMHKSSASDSLRQTAEGQIRTSPSLINT